MKETVTIEEPRIARFLFASPVAAIGWLVLRVWLGYQWLHAGWEKVTGTESGWHLAFTHDSWLRTSAGLKGFAGFALTTAGKPRSRSQPDDPSGSPTRGGPFGPSSRS